MLYGVQRRLKERVLNKLPLLAEVRGYRTNSHNINTAADVCGHTLHGQGGHLEVPPVHHPRHVAAALTEHGLSAVVVA